MSKKKNRGELQPKDEARNERYNEYVNAVTPQTGTAKSLFQSFLVGGLICLIGEILFNIFRALFPNMSEMMAGTLMVMVLIVAAVLLTGLGVYDVMARKGGAGMFLPISGFANAMASASMEHKSEGLIMGTSVKLFSVVGPVLVNGIVWSSLVGIIRLIMG